MPLITVQKEGTQSIYRIIVDDDQELLERVVPLNLVIDDAWQVVLKETRRPLARFIMKAPRDVQVIIKNRNTLDLRRQNILLLNQDGTPFIPAPTPTPLPFVTPSHKEEQFSVTTKHSGSEDLQRASNRLSIFRRYLKRGKDAD